MKIVPCRALLGLAVLTGACAGGAVRTPDTYGYCDPLSPEDRRAVIDPAARGELRLSPLFASCGVVFGGGDTTNGLSVAWRKKGTDAAWQRTDLYWFADVANARGVIRGLDEDTEYEAEASAGGAVCAKGTFRTWKSDVPVARTVEVDPATAKFPIVVSDRGTPTGWVRYVAKDGRPIVNREEAMTFVVTNAAYVVFDDMKIVGGRAKRVFHLTDSTGVRIRHCDISGWGFKGVSRFDDRGRVYERWDEKQKRYVGGDGQHAIFVDVGMKETVIERCWIHDPAGRSHAWRYSHPHGPMAMMMSRPDGATVIRWNDFVGSDLHRWDDGIGGNMNFWEDGGFNRNAEVYGNFICFANDDCIELDGGQQNVLCAGNRFEGSYMGVSVQGCVVSPSYVVDNLVSGIGDEFGAGCTALKPNGFDFHKRGAPVCVFADNTCWGPGRVFDPLKRAGPTGRFVQSGNRFVAESEPVVPDYPRRPAGFLLDVARMDVGRDHSPRAIRVRLTGGATEVPYEIAKNDAFDWLRVTPERGVLTEGSELTVSFDETKMRDRPLYRGAFLVRTPEGLSRPVTVYASTGWTQPLTCDRPGEVAVYAYPKDATTDKDRYSVYSFDVPKPGRYYFMVFAQAEGRAQVYAAVDGDEPKPTEILPGRDFPAWSIVPPGIDGGARCRIRYFDFEAGRHTLRIRPWRGRCKLKAVVLTDSPGSFEPKLGGMACEALQAVKDVPQCYLDEIAATKCRFDAWKGTDAVVAFPVVTDVHSFGGEIVPGAWRDAKNHIRIVRQAAVAFGADFTADLGDLGFDCYGSHRVASTREQAERRLQAEETLYRDFPVPTIFCIGNHDYGRDCWKPGEHVTAAEFGRRFNGLARAKGVSFVGPDSLDYGYWDVPGKNCRVIFLNTAELAPRRGVSPEQVAFFRRALETLPKGSVALALSHITPNYSLALWANAKPRTYRGMADLRTAAEAFVAAGGRFAGFVSGDSHFDWQTTVNGVAYLTTQGYGNIGASELPKDGAVHWPRGEDKRQCLVDVVAVKPQTGETRLFRIGAGGAEADRVLCGSIQSRIDAASEAGGGVVAIAPGRYADVRPIVLKSNVTLDVQEGAVIQASTNFADYAFLPGQDRGAFISAIGATNVAIIGGGRIECSGDRMPKLKGVPGRWRGIHLVRCRGVKLEDVTLANAHSWCCYLQQCEDVLVRKVKIVNHANFNNDGLDLEVRNALVEDCDIDSDDDSIVLKNHDPNFVVENVEVRRCRVGGNTNSLKIGTETSGDFRNIYIHDCVVSPRQNSGVWPLSDDVPGLDKTVPSGKGGLVLATVDGGTIDGVTVRNITMEGVETPIYVRLGRRRGGERESGLRNVLIENVKAKAVSRIACSVTGVFGEPKRRIENVVLRDIALDVPGGTAGDERLAEPVPECEKGYPSPRNFFFHPLPACGVYIRHADGVKLENVTVSRRAPDIRPDVVREDAP